MLKGKEKIGKEFAYLIFLFRSTCLNPDIVENEFRTRAKAIGFEVGVLTKEEQEEFKNKYKTEAMKIIDNNIKTGRFNPEL